MAGGIRRKHSDERSGPYLVTACDYVHLNPARVRLVAAEEPLESRGRSSDPAYLRPQLRTPGLRVDRVMGEPGLQRTGRAIEELATARIAEEELPTLPKGDSRKVAMARQRMETPMTRTWIARRPGDEQRELPVGAAEASSRG